MGVKGAFHLVEDRAGFGSLRPNCPLAVPAHLSPRWMWSPGRERDKAGPYWQIAAKP